MADKICLDTDFLVNFLRGGVEESDFVNKNELKNTLATTYINLFELYFGAYKSGSERNINKLRDIQERLSILNLTQNSVEQAGKILAELQKSGNLIDFRDLLIGCIANSEGFSMKTYNKKHFSRIPDLKVLS